ncbi:hypothetical protein D1Z90_10300 [Motilimonas pumila]|uniref:Uncharacterized protein n=1 Tax=Motilimonas pumila TaxID=2303987 RepID=A0A418YEF6_9GAMM|nr:hypothetical protein D1Z90_10300 [Motilimonas pumila]
MVFVDSGTALLSDIEYQAFDGPVAWQNGNGTAYRQRRDVDGRTGEITLQHEGEDDALWQQVYAFDSFNKTESLDSHL